MSETVYFLTICLPLLTVLLVFGMKYFSAMQQAKANQSREEAYRLLAQSSSQTQQEVAAGLGSVQTEMEAMNLRLAEIERILKQVE